MDTNLIGILIRDVLVPEIARIVRRHHADTRTLPTDAEIIAKLNTDADYYIAKGKAFLAATDPATLPPTP